MTREEALKELSNRYDAKIFLPTVGDVRELYLQYKGPAITTKPSKKKIFSFLANDVPEKVLIGFIENRSFSGPAKLAPISEAIKRRRKYHDA